MPTLVLDNGGSTCRLGWAPPTEFYSDDNRGLAKNLKPSISIPNATAQQRGNLDTFVADQIKLIKNQGTLTFTRPCERGIVTNWPCQIEIWNRALPQAFAVPPPALAPYASHANEGSSACAAVADGAGSGGGEARPLGRSSSSIGPNATTLLVTSAPFTPDSLTSYLDQVVFEEFGFAALQRLPAPAAAAALYQHEAAAAAAAAPNPAASSSSSSSSLPSTSLNEEEGSGSSGGGSLCCLVLDLGFSATYAVPSLRGRSIQEAVRRLNVGGRLLTAYTQEVVSYRQYNMMDEVTVVNHAKEALCYVAPPPPPASSLRSALEAELHRSVGPLKRAEDSCYAEWVLPDYSPGNEEGHQRELRVDDFSGRLKRTRKNDESKAQALRFESERFCIPEILFFPSDIGLNQGGIHELIVEAVSACDAALQPLLYNNVVLTGGCAKFPGLRERLLAELRPLVPAHFPLRVTMAPDPETFNWRGAAFVAAASSPSSSLDTRSLRGSSQQQQQQPPLVATITKAEYEEQGSEYSNSKFRDW